jgi:hypothetical protein
MGCGSGCGDEPVLPVLPPLPPPLDGGLPEPSQLVKYQLVEMTPC